MLQIPLKYIWIHTYITEYQRATSKKSCQMCFESYVDSPEKLSDLLKDRHLDHYSICMKKKQTVDFTAIFDLSE